MGLVQAALGRIGLDLVVARLGLGKTLVGGAWPGLRGCLNLVVARLRQGRTLIVARLGLGRTLVRGARLVPGLRGCLLMWLYLVLARLGLGHSGCVRRTLVEGTRLVTDLWRCLLG